MENRDVEGAVKSHTLLSLPFEIRSLVYDYLFHNTPHYLSGSPIICRPTTDQISSSSAESQFNYGGFKQPPRTSLRSCAAIILSCRQLYHEALAIYYQHAWVYCTYKYAMNDLIASPHFAAQRKYIRRLFGISMLTSDSMSMIVQAFPSLEILGLREDQPIPVPRSGPLTYDIDTAQVVVRAKQQQQFLPSETTLYKSATTSKVYGLMHDEVDCQIDVARRPLRVIKKVIVEAGLVAGSILHACYVVDFEKDAAWFAWRHICSISSMRARECAFSNEPWYHGFYHTPDGLLRTELAAETISRGAQYR